MEKMAQRPKRDGRRDVRRSGGKWKRRQLGRAGSTMVELITAFALLGIFLAAGAMVTGTYFRMFTRTREYGSQRVLASTLLDALQYELETAVEAGQEEAEREESGEEEDGTVLGGAKLLPGSGGVSYRNCDGLWSQLTIEENGYLRIDRGEASLLYGPAVYSRNRVEQLSFEPLEGAKTEGIVKMTLTLESTAFPGLTCEMSRVVYCYNLEEL